jgi:hypothetical protein
VYEYHGWATIYESASGEDGAEEIHAETIERLNELIRRFKNDMPAHLTVHVDLRLANGMWHLSLAGMHNHYSSKLRSSTGRSLAKRPAPTVSCTYTTARRSQMSSNGSVTS